jgi:hypothetical protein
MLGGSSLPVFPSIVLHLPKETWNPFVRYDFNSVEARKVLEAFNLFEQNIHIDVLLEDTLSAF